MNKFQQNKFTIGWNLNKNQFQIALRKQENLLN